MAVFEPCRALRFAPDLLRNRVAPPYDVLSDDDVRQLRERGAVEITRVDVPTVDSTGDPYAEAALLFHSWIDQGHLTLDDLPTFTIYRMEFTDATGQERRIDGVIGAVEVVDEGAGGVLAHERTTPKASTDRLDLTRSTQANLSPIWGLSSAEGLTSLLSAPGEFVGEVDWEGVRHRFEVVTDAGRCAAISDCLAGADILIADGHHRYGVARMFRDEVRDATGRTDTPAERTLMFVNEMIAEQLAVAAIHRIYRGTSVNELCAALDPYFEVIAEVEVEESTLTNMDEHDAICVVSPDGHGRLLRARESAFNGVRDLDGLRLEVALSDLNPEVSYQHGVTEVLHMLGSGDIDVAILIRPVSIDEIRRTAEQHELMPPKSTFFTPKLLTGPVIRPMTRD